MSGPLCKCGPRFEQHVLECSRVFGDFFANNFTDNTYNTERKRTRPRFDPATNLWPAAGLMDTALRCFIELAAGQLSISQSRFRWSNGLSNWLQIQMR